MSKNKELVIIAMSGGVDSSVAAAVLADQGFRVVGVTMLLWPEEVAGTQNRCCSSQDLADARAVSARLGIRHYSMDLRAQFLDEVVRPFGKTYLDGKTPNPCILCNEHLKFRHLLLKARALGADRLATGHYARVAGGGPFTLTRGRDPEKDQSYFLFPVDQEILGRLLFPLGGMKKEKVRDLARDLGLPVHEKPDSQEICFVPEGGLRDFIKGQAKCDIEPGPIVDTTGNRLGTHEGICFYTVGQRRGLGVAAAEPLYVVSLEPGTNTVVVGSRYDASSIRLTAQRANWISGEPPAVEFNAGVQVRHRQLPASATIRVTGPDEFEVVFEEPQHGVAPGQAAVLYDGDMVLGGGWIA